MLDKPEWHYCEACRRWFPSENSFIKHNEHEHIFTPHEIKIHYTPEEENALIRRGLSLLEN